jgi:hypothetical protein
MPDLNLFVNWPGRPLFDQKLIKGHQFCINKHKVHSFLSSQLLTQEERSEIFSLEGLLAEIVRHTLV